ncbi:fatty acyl-AMP ligase [Streptomyces sp. S.PB5]|uniref:fatty acyl-AMP ligase n=1 Tax=Streptomyces sp. S.PB5 TaxID=3020844 RepID=UPI0025AEF44C|nr:fatty acyl-AMP ligase [Streptomyces sp. S.PB5]MDN3022227.1 fatty acyl-AMP ligase [Streptomyces sp. S.PB5]
MSSRTFTEVILENMAAHAAKDALIHLQDDTAEHVTYAALDTRARRIAVWLRARGAVGRQVLLLHPSGTAFTAAFLGCLYAGAVAVPAPVPTDQGRGLARVTGILRDAEAVAVLTSPELAPALEAWLAAENMPHVHCLGTDGEGDFADPADWRPPATGPGDLAFLQYTSGSTSDPKGVMVTHANLLANEAAIQAWTGTGPDTVGGGWLPHYHDLGLIGHILQPLYAGGTAVLMPPTAFLKRPHRWLKMIDDYRLSGSGGPNFAFDLCVRRVTDEQLATLDLSGWRVAPNGAEPVRADTLQAFADRFAPAGFRPETFFPCYGMAETTLLVTGCRPKAPPVTRQVDATALELGELAPPVEGSSVRTLAGSGTVRDCEIRVTDPATGADRPPGAVGEIWVRGPSVTPGYFRNPRATAESRSPDGWLRTGDLGVLDGGELFVTGRLKEVIILAGRNVYPHDVERTVQSADRSLAAGTGAAFAVQSAAGEHLVVVQEVRAAAVPDGDLRAVATAVQLQIGRQFSVAAGNVVLVRPGTVRRTTSGKVQRTLMRRLFLEGALVPLYEVLEPAVRELVSDAADRALARVSPA